MFFDYGGVLCEFVSESMFFSFLKETDIFIPTVHLKRWESVTILMISQSISV